MPLRPSGQGHGLEFHWALRAAVQISAALLRWPIYSDAASMKANKGRGGGARTNMAKERSHVDKEVMSLHQIWHDVSYLFLHSSPTRICIFAKIGRKNRSGLRPEPPLLLFIQKMKEYRKISAYFAILEGCLDFSKFLRAPCRARIKCETSGKPIGKPIELCTLRDTCAFLLGCSLSARWRAIKANCAHRWEVRNFLQT